MKKIGKLDLNSQQRLIIYDTDFESPTLQAAMGTGGGNIPLIIDKAIRLGNIYGADKEGGFAGNVWDKECLCPTLKTCSGGQSQPLIVAMRGRNPENPSDRTPGIETEQRLEPNTNGTANTITSVQKDNLVLERNTSLTEEELGVKKLGHIEKGTGVHQSNIIYDKEGLAPCICAGMGVKQQPTMIIDDLYENRDKRVYEEYAPTLRSDRSRLKKIEINTISTKGKK